MSRMLEELGWEPLQERRLHRLAMMSWVVVVVVVVVDLFRNESVHSIENIQNSNIEIPYFVPG